MQLRHPLALAHVANHPAPVDKPNVMVAAYDFTLLAGKPICTLAALLASLHCDGLCILSGGPYGSAFDARARIQWLQQIG